MADFLKNDFVPCVESKFSVSKPRTPGITPAAIGAAKTSCASFRELGSRSRSRLSSRQNSSVQGDRVIVLGSIRAKVKQTGLVYDNEWAMCWTLRDGRVTKWQIYEDTARELAAHAPAGAAWLTPAS